MKTHLLVVPLSLLLLLSQHSAVLARSDARDIRPTMVIRPTGPTGIHPIDMKLKPTGPTGVRRNPMPDRDQDTERVNGNKTATGSQGLAVGKNGLTPGMLLSHVRKDEAFLAKLKNRRDKLREQGANTAALDAVITKVEPKITALKTQIGTLVNEVKAADKTNITSLFRTYSPKLAAIKTAAAEIQELFKTAVAEIKTLTVSGASEK